MYPISMPETAPRIKGLFRREIVANTLMAIFAAATTIGCSLVLSVGAGLICLGITSGIVGYLLGAE